VFEASRSMAGATGLEPATSGVTGRRSKPTELRPRGPRPPMGTPSVPRKGCQVHPAARHTLWVGVVGDEGFEPPTPSV
jgi:hypothetical protein